ncbi:MAG: MFS transporter [Planctomycetaceae bacterium]|nr:MAG: MFS transporter [Planctomycetaceae bacterium]
MSNSSTISSSHRALFLASFFTLIAAGIGFSVRGAILDDWGAAFGFDKTALGGLTGAGLVGFGVTIIIGSLFADMIGYKPLMVLAFLLHVGSALVTFAATPVYKSMGATPEAAKAAYDLLWWGALLFSLANGVCESVINPLVATLFPKQKTHYLNILHAGWPGGLILGGILSLLFCGKDAYITRIPWELAVAFFLPPTLYYGWVIFKEKFPQSETKSAGVPFATMLAEFASPMLLCLFVLHAMVGYVELGTDGWIQNIMNASIGKAATWLFIWTSGIMFALRFFAGPIVEKINPVGLLLISAVLAFLGLRGLGTEGISGTTVLLMGTIYGIGKTFFWPTMLGVVGERFPKGGALTMGFIGGIGMLSAGLLGGPGIGYKQDYYVANDFKTAQPSLYDEYKSAEAHTFLPGLPAVAGFDGKKLDAIREKKDDARSTSEKQVLDGNLSSGKYALRMTAWVPAMMAVGYLLLVLYFQSKGGYQVEVLHGAKPEGEHYTGGVAGPMEA